MPVLAFSDKSAIEDSKNNAATTIILPSSISSNQFKACLHFPALPLFGEKLATCQGGCPLKAQRAQSVLNTTRDYFPGKSGKLQTAEKYRKRDPLGFKQVYSLLKLSKLRKP